VEKDKKELLRLSIFMLVIGVLMIVIDRYNNILLLSVLGFPLILFSLLSIIFQIFQINEKVVNND